MGPDMKGRRAVQKGTYHIALKRKKTLFGSSEVPMLAERRLCCAACATSSVELSAKELGRGARIRKVKLSLQRLNYYGRTCQHPATQVSCSEVGAG
jgi:hypothetical protein